MKCAKLKGVDAPSPLPKRFVRLFGPLRVERDGRPLLSPASRKTRAILGYLALSPRAVSRQRLCDLFFDVPDDPRAALRWSLTKIRPLVDDEGAIRLIGERDALRLDLRDVSVDALQVQALAARSMETLSHDDCAEALALMSSDLLEDCDLPERPEFSAWLAAQRQDFQDIARRLAGKLADEATGEEKIVRLRQLAALDPLDETAATALARALTGLGRRDEAHEAVARSERYLRQAGLQAGPALRMALRAAPTAPIAAMALPTIANTPPPSNDERISAAVIPFLNHSPDLIPDELMDGLLEAVVHMLSKFRDIRVAGLSKALQYKGNIRDPAAMGADLGVSHLVGGSVMAREGVLKLRYRIVVAADGALLTSGDVEHSAADAFALLEDAPAQLVVLLAHHLADAARRTAIAKPEAQRTAQDHFLTGVHLGFFSTPLDYPASLAAFEAGLKLRPDHASLNAYSVWAKAGLGHALREPERTQALAQAHLAMTQADSDADAMAIAAWSAVHIAQDFEPALRAADVATRLNPLSRIAWSASAWIRAMAGEFETPMRHWDNAERCNPLGSNIDNTHGGRALCLWMAGRYQEAAEAAKRCLERQPGHAGGHMAAVAAAVALGEPRGIQEATQAMLRFHPDAPDTPVMASIPIRDVETKTRLLDAIRSARGAPVSPAIREATAARLPVVAILPIADLSRDPLPDYLRDGLFDGLAHALSRFRSITLIAGASAKRFGAKLEDPAAIGEALGADLLIGLSVMATPQALRLRWRAIDARTGALSASGEAQGDPSDLWALQEDLAARIAVQIEPRAQEEALKRSLQRPTDSPSAYDHYLRGLYAAFGAARQDYRAGLTAFEAALAIDPNFAPAAAMAPWAAIYGGFIRSRNDIARYSAMARHAARLADDDARSLALAATAILYLDHDFDFGERLVLRAIDINPNEHSAWICAGWISIQRGRRTEAFARLARAESLNPVAYAQDGIHAGRALACFFDGLLDEAEDHVRLALEHQPESPSAVSAGLAIAALRKDETVLPQRLATFLRLYPEGRQALAVQAIPFADPELRRRFFEALGLGGAP